MQSAFLILSASVSIVAVCHAESHTLKVARPEKVGDKAELSVRALDQTSRTLTADGKAVKEETTYGSGSLDAVREVLAVNDRGRPTKLRFTVRSLRHTADREAEPGEILPEGGEVIAVRNGRGKSFTVDGGEPGEALAKALKLVVSLGDENASFDVDSMFDTGMTNAICRVLLQEFTVFR